MESSSTFVDCMVSYAWSYVSDTTWKHPNHSAGLSSILSTRCCPIRLGIRMDSQDDALFDEITYVEDEIGRFRSTTGNLQDYVPLLRLNPFGLTMLSGGLGTVTTLLQWSIVLLAQPLDVQEKAWKDIPHFYSDEQPLCDPLEDQKYTSPYSDEARWSDPEELRPERWLEVPDAPMFTYGIGYRMSAASMLANRELYLVFIRMMNSLENQKFDDVDAHPVSGNSDPTSLVAMPHKYKARFVPSNSSALEKGFRVVDEPLWLSERQYNQK
ncbi:hypothetical protein WAI453_013374 [Rhynchosporium graminicola]